MYSYLSFPREIKNARSHVSISFICHADEEIFHDFIFRWTLSHDPFQFISCVISQQNDSINVYTILLHVYK